MNTSTWHKALKQENERLVLVLCLIGREDSAESFKPITGRSNEQQSIQRVLSKTLYPMITKYLPSSHG